MFACLIVAVVIPSIVLGHHHIIPCPGGLPAPTDIRVRGCDHDPCHVYNGEDVSYEMDFRATHSTGSLTLAMTANVFGVDREVALPPPLTNACNSLINGSCPVTVGESLTQGTSIPVGSEYHGGIPAQVRLTISDVHDGHVHVCVCALLNIVIH